MRTDRFGIKTSDSGTISLPHLILCFFILLSTCCWGQEDIVFSEDTVLQDIITTPPTDSLSLFPVDTSVVKEKKHSPALAGGLSAALPGLGQAYNKKYWKIPINWAGFAATGYFVYHFSSLYIDYRDEYRNRLNGKEPKLEPDLHIDNINIKKLGYQNNMQLSIIALAAWYFINILDAVVDAHLMSFDISDNLSMHLAPDIPSGFAYGNSYKPPTLGLSFTLNLK